MSSYLDLFQEFAQYLKVIEGTKNMVLFSGGFSDGNLAVGANRTWSDQGEGFASGEIISTARRLVEVLEGSGIKVYTIENGDATSLAQMTNSCSTRSPSRLNWRRLSVSSDLV